MATIMKTKKMATPVIFTSSSSRDGSSRITVTCSRLGISARVGEVVLVVIKQGRKYYHVSFTCNRYKKKGSILGSTLKTTSWPTGLSIPKPGQPHKFQVEEVVIGQ